jgi:hypothetical protein
MFKRKKINRYCCEKRFKNTKNILKKAPILKRSQVNDGYSLLSSPRDILLISMRKWTFYPSVPTTNLNGLLKRSLLKNANLKDLSGSITVDFAKKICWVASKDNFYTVLLNSPYVFLVRKKVLENDTEGALYFNIYRRFIAKKLVYTGYFVLDNRKNGGSREVFNLFDLDENLLKLKQKYSDTVNISDDFGNNFTAPANACYESTFFSFDIA